MNAQNIDPNSAKAGLSVLAFGISILAVMLMVIIAGTSEGAANATLTFMVGLWLVFLVAHPGVGSVTQRALGSFQ